MKSEYRSKTRGNPSLVEHIGEPCDRCRELLIQSLSQ